ncbi:hypothetical protein CS369_01285 [Candidatus Symbiopectobacterium sp. 'North America']|nr:hypothetical protein [Candidatus Symbiopectobacterium sp. 'North America']
MGVMRYVTVAHKEMVEVAAELVFREIYLLFHLQLSVAMVVTVVMLLQRVLTAAVAREQCSLVE